MLGKHRIWTLGCLAVGMLILVLLVGFFLLGGSECGFEGGSCKLSRKAGLQFKAEVSRRPLVEMDREKCVKALQIPQVLIFVNPACKNPKNSQDSLLYKIAELTQNGIDHSLVTCLLAVRFAFNSTHWCGLCRWL